MFFCVCDIQIIFLILALGMILHYVFQNLPSPTTREALVSVTKFPLFFGTVLFALEAVGVVCRILFYYHIIG